MKVQQQSFDCNTEINAMIHQTTSILSSILISLSFFFRYVAVLIFPTLVLVWYQDTKGSSECMSAIYSWLRQYFHFHWLLSPGAAVSGSSGQAATSLSSLAAPWQHSLSLLLLLSCQWPSSAFPPVNTLRLWHVSSIGAGASPLLLLLIILQQIFCCGLVSTLN